MPDYLKYNFIKQLMPDKIYQRVRLYVNSNFSSRSTVIYTLNFACASTFTQLRRAILFAPDDPNNLHQTVPQRHIEGLNVERIKGYRYPAPGSRTGARVPVRDSSDMLYDTNYAPRDPRNLPDTVSSFKTSAN